MLYFRILIFLILSSGISQLMAESQNAAYINALAPLIVLIASPLIIRLFKKLGIEINNSALDPILMRLIEICASVNANKKELSGPQKKELVSAMASTMLPRSDIKALVKKYGSLDTAVQAAFEQSSLAKK